MKMDDITEEYRTSLADLTQNSKPLINMLTMLAEDNETHASKIVEVIETHLQQVEPAKKLPTLYLIDSIIKNLPKSTYPALFSHNIVNIFCNMFEQVDEKTRQCMFKVRQTWNQHFASRKMYALDVRVNNIDHAWPLSTPASSIAPSIHVNPRFIAPKDAGLPLPDSQPIEDDEAEMRRQLIAKQAELLKIQQKRLELELKETETRLKQQKKPPADLFVGVESESTDPTSQLQSTSRDPRLRDPRIASRDPRVCRDPRMRNKPVTAELLPNASEVQPVLTFFGPTTNQPLNQLGEHSSIKNEDHLEPPQIVPATMLPHPMPTAAPQIIPTGPPIPSDFGNQNNQAIPPIKQEPIEHKHIPSPKKDFKSKPQVEVKTENKSEDPVTGDKPKIDKENATSQVKVKTEKSDSISPKEKEKRRSDPKKSGVDSGGKESKEREVNETKSMSTRNSHGRNRSSNSESKSRSDSKERGRSKNKDDVGKSQNIEEKDRSKIPNSDNQRGKEKRTHGESQEDLRKRNNDRNGAGDGRDKGKNWNESRNRRSKSPKISRERSRSPVKESGRGSKNQPRKNKNKNESKNNANNEATEPKVEQKKPISSLPRIPKRTGVDVDERVIGKDKDERRHSSNKRDLDERNDLRGHEAERNSKKPRISQERDVSQMEPMQVQTNMNQDISNLFGNEDQDYRHPDIVSPRGGGGGWARYKADHPKDFDNRRSSFEDIDHRREMPPRDTDYRPAPFNRPPGRSPVYNEPGRQPSEAEVPLELRLENRQQILRTMEMRRKSGEISSEEVKTVLLGLSEFDSMQEQKRHQPYRQEPPRLEPEIHPPRDDRYFTGIPPKEPLMEYQRRDHKESMSYQSPVKEPRNFPIDADMRRPGHHSDRNRDLDERGYSRGENRPPFGGPDRHLNRGDRPKDGGPPYRTDRPKDDRIHARGPERQLMETDDRPPYGRPLIDHPPSLLGPGPAPRREPLMHYDVDHRKPPQMEKGIPSSDLRKADIEAGRSPSDRSIEERPSLLGPGPGNLRDKAPPLNKSESLPPVEPDVEKSDQQKVNEKLGEKKMENSGLAVGAMLEMLRSENTPENSQDVPPKMEKDNSKQSRNSQQNKTTKSGFDDEPVPELLPKPIYDSSKDDRWLTPGGGRMLDGALNIFPPGTEEIVLNGQPFPIRLGGPKCIIDFKGEKLEVFTERRMIHINGVPVYKVSDPVQDASWGPGPNQRAQVFYHGNPRNLWIDGFLYLLRIDAPPKIIKFREKEYTILIDGRDGMILINKKDFGTYGGKPRFERLEGERVELRFTPPPRNIVIDGEQCQIHLDRKIPFIVMKDVARGIRFDGPPREVIVNNQKLFIPTERAVEVRIDNILHMIAFGGPSHEIIIDGIWYELQFNGPPREIIAGTHKLLVGLPTLPPDVKILDPIENQKLKDPDVDTRNRHGKDKNKKGSKGRNSPVSLLDMNVPKPPGLRKDGDRDRKRSPERRDKRRRSPKRERSPDQRRRSPYNIDERSRDSPLRNDHQNFNGPQGPGNIPPMQGPPFMPNQQRPFMPNAPFPGPNQPQFPPGSNQRFPSGPNPMQFPGGPGPNPPFSSGPNQIFPHGPNQPIQSGPVFPEGPRPPMPLDDGSQGPHPMFQPGGNQQFPQGPPMLSNPNMTVPQTMPVMSQPIMPPTSMMQTGLIPVSGMNQPIVHGNIGQPPDLMQTQPPALEPQLNVASLLQKLIKVGLITAKAEEKPEKVETKEPVKEETKKKDVEENVEGKEKRKPVRIKPSKLEKIPDLTEMTLSKLKEQYTGVIQRMYSGIQCTSCGTRFMASQTKLYREHLDWHFRQNQREKKGAKISRYRSWFYQLNDWLEYEDVGDVEERAHMSLFEQQSKEAAEKEAVLPKDENVVHCPAASSEDSADACVVCGDVFEQFFDEESEEWHLKNALRFEDKTYHPVCYEDAQKNSTPKVDPGADPMLLQIQKELGYVPADTVVSFPAANVISVSQHDHTPKELFPDSPVAGAEEEKNEEAAAS